MKTRLYVVYDRVAQESGPVFEAKNNGVARRQFVNMLNQERALNKDDYELICVAVMDHSINVVEPEPFPELIMRGFDEEAVLKIGEDENE